MYGIQQKFKREEHQVLPVIMLPMPFQDVAYF